MFLYQFEEKWEELGWSVSYDDNDTVELSQGSPAGEDFYFTVPKLNFCDEVFDYANDFDPEEHAKENLGMSGAPGLRELLDDADAIKRMLLELSEALCKVEREATRWYLMRTILSAVVNSVQKSSNFMPSPKSLTMILWLFMNS